MGFIGKVVQAAKKAKSVNRAASTAKKVAATQKLDDAAHEARMVEANAAMAEDKVRKAAQQTAKKESEAAAQQLRTDQKAVQDAKIAKDQAKLVKAANFGKHVKTAGVSGAIGATLGAVGFSKLNAANAKESIDKGAALKAKGAAMKAKGVAMKTKGATMKATGAALKNHKRGGVTKMQKGGTAKEKAQAAVDRAYLQYNRDFAAMKQKRGVVPPPTPISKSIQIPSYSKYKKGGVTKSFPDLNKDGKITKADVLKGRGVIKKTGGATDSKWIQKAVNPKHKGYCTPMSKPTCTPKRKALARTFKAMAKNK